MTPSEYGFSFVGEIILPEKAISKSNSKARYLEKKYRDFEQRIVIACRSLPYTAPTSRGWVVYECHFAKRIHCDISNLSKSIFDGLVKGGVFTDDKEIAVTGCPPFYDGRDKTIIKIYK